MDTDLKALETRVAHLIELCQQLRNENIELRQDLAQSQNALRQLKENMMLAGDHLEALIESLPGAA